MRYVDRTAKKLARNLFYAMVRFGPALEKRQAVLGRLVDIGSELFVMTAACVRASKMLRDDPRDRTPVELGDQACRLARFRIRGHFRTLFRNEDARTYRTAQGAMEGRYAWLEKGIVPGPSSASVLEAGVAEGAEDRSTAVPSEVGGTAGVA